MLNELIDRMRKLAGLNELNIRKKSPINHGMEHNIYKSELNPDVLIKTKKRGMPLDSDTAEYFQKYPQIFAKVDRSSPNYMAVEKLDTAKVKQDQQHIAALCVQYGLAKDMHDGRIYNFMGRLAVPDTRQKIDALMGDDPVVQRYIEFRERMQPLIDDVHGFNDGNRNWRNNVDYSADNMGYDKEGVLKLLDF